MNRLTWLPLSVLLTLIACVTVDQPPEGVDPESEIEALPEPSVERLDTYFERLEDLGFSGAVLVEHRGEVALRRGYGLADREARRPYTPETVQTHGSITKQMTAAAILLLESRGELAVEDQISRYLGQVPPDKAGITVHHLLTHSAGFPGGIGRDAEPIGADEFLDRALATPLRFDPGSSYAYSNVGYSLLGILIERVSGRSYERFIREELLLPAGLADTGYLLPDWSDDRLAEGYQEGQHWGRVHRRHWRDDGPGWNLRANGGLHTTVDDMHRWLDVLRGRGPLPASAVAKWTTPYVDEGGGDFFYAYGWAVGETEAGKVVTHNGGNGIFSADFIWLPDAEMFLYIHGNTSVVAAAQLQDSLLAALFDPGFELPPAVVADPAADPGRASVLEGTYAADGGILTLSADDVRLIATVSGQAALDALLGHDRVQRQRLDELNDQSREVVQRLEAGREDALDGVVPAGEDATARTRRLLDVIERGGELRSLTVVGSVANVPGSRFADVTPWTTFVRADYENLAQMWSLLWDEDGRYRGTGIGPVSDVPSFVLVPAGEGAFTGIETDAPWREAAFRFEGDCLLVGELRFCR